MAMRRLKCALLAMIASFSAVCTARAVCNPTEFLLQDYTHITWSEQLKLSFILTATKEQYDNVRKSWNVAGGYGLFYGSLDYDEAKQAASRETQSRRLDYSQSDFLDYTSQRLSDKGVEAYAKCLTLDPNTPQLNLWVAKLERGIHYTINAFWVGGRTEGKGREIKFVLKGADLDSKPDIWPKAETQEIDVTKKSKDVDAFLSVDISNIKKSIWLLSDLPPPRKYSVVSSKRIGITSGGSGRNDGWCQRRTNSDCVAPVHQGYLEAGSGQLENLASSGRTGWSVIVDTPEKICVEVWAATGDCDVEVSISGVVAATERATETSAPAAVIYGNSAESSTSAQNSVLAPATTASIDNLIKLKTTTFDNPKKQ